MLTKKGLRQGLRSSYHFFNLVPAPALLGGVSVLGDQVAKCYDEANNFFGRYWSASRMCSSFTYRDSSRSAMVRASLMMR